jgi:DNA repair exonuclease SbcCD ATPase subunit
MLNLESLRFQNIGRFVEVQEIDFSNLGNFVQVDGQNNNTKGSSGSGKSTVFNSLDYLLGLNDLPTTVLQSRASKEPIAVTGTFSWDGKPLTITRSKSKLSVLIDGSVIEGSNALAEEQIDKILGMSRDLFRKTLTKRQKEGGFFLDFTPQKMHDFLVDCLELGEYKNKLTIVDNKIKDILANKTKLESELLANKTGLSATQDALLSLGLPPIKDIHREMVIELKTKADKAEVEFNEVSNTCKLKMDSLMAEKPETSVSAFDTGPTEQYRKEQKELEDKLNSVILAEKDRVAKVKHEISKKEIERQSLTHKLAAADKAREEAVKIASQVKAIRACSCPMCEQQWITESAKTTEIELLKKISELKATIDSAASTKAQLTEIDLQLSELLPQGQSQGQVHPELPDIYGAIENRKSLILMEKAKEKEFLDGQNRVNSLLTHAFEDKRKDLMAQNNAFIEQYRGQLDLCRRALDMAVHKLKAYEEAKIKYETAASSLKQKEENFTKKVEDIQKELINAEKSLLINEEIKKLVKTYISYSFDDALDAIGDKATEIIRCVPNVSCGTIQFEGTKESRDGKIKEEVSAVISMDGEIGIPIKSLSGGERSAIDLAVDLAVIDFIEARSGKGMNVFILDEPFTGLGTVEIEMALEVLKNSNTNKRIIITDHNPEVREMVQDRIIVERTGTTSKIATKEANV